MAIRKNDLVNDRIVDEKQKSKTDELKKQNEKNPSQSEAPRVFCPEVANARRSLGVTYTDDPAVNRPFRPWTEILPPRSGECGDQDGAANSD